MRWKLKQKPQSHHFDAHSYVTLTDMDRNILSEEIRTCINWEYVSERVINESEVVKDVLSFLGFYELMKGDKKNIAKWLRNEYQKNKLFDDRFIREIVFMCIHIPWDRSALPDKYYTFLKEASDGYLKMHNRTNLQEMFEKAEIRRQAERN